MLTFDNFKQIFSTAKKPYWIAYKGTGTGVQIGSHLNDDETAADTSIEESLQRLENIVGLYGDGIYTVVCRSSKNASRGNDQHTFMYGDAQAAKVSGTAQAPAAAPNSFFSGMNANFFLEKTFAVQNELQRAQIELVRKEMQIEQLKRDAKEKQAAENGPSIGSFINQNPKIVETLITNILGVQAPAAIGVLKAAAPIPAQKEDDDDEDSEGYEYEAGKIDLNALFEAAHRIQRAIPQTHVNDILDKLADFAETNPELAAQMLTQL